MKHCALALFVLAMLFGISAQALAGDYVSINGGAVFMQDSDFSVDDVADNLEFSYDNGYVVNLALGHTYKQGGRIEAEFNYRTNDLDELSVSGAGNFPTDGKVTSWGAMVNAYYDLETGTAVKPFVGAGVGYANVKLEWDGEDDDDGVLAYQLMTGCGFAVNERITIDLQYRYFAADDPEYSFGDDELEIGATSEYQNHNAMLGVRFNF